MDLVIGSGPSGAACAAALLAQGRRVHMLDAGLRAKPDCQAAIESTRTATEPWLPEHAPWHAESAAPASEKIPNKLVFGSDYPFREATDRIGLVSEGSGLRSSMALGGHSTLWRAFRRAQRQHIYAHRNQLFALDRGWNGDHVGEQSVDHNSVEYSSIGQERDRA